MLVYTTDNIPSLLLPPFVLTHPDTEPPDLSTHNTTDITLSQPYRKDILDFVKTIWPRVLPTLRVHVFFEAVNMQLITSSHDPVPLSYFSNKTKYVQVQLTNNVALYVCYSEVTGTRLHPRFERRLPPCPPNPNDPPGLIFVQHESPFIKVALPERDLLQYEPLIPYVYSLRVSASKLAMAIEYAVIQAPDYLDILETITSPHAPIPLPPKRKYIKKTLAEANREWAKPWRPYGM